MKEEQLIFIASQPRSGSTYLQNVLSNNSVTNTVSEPWVMLSLAPILKPSLVYASSYNHKFTMLAVTDYISKTGADLKAEIKSLALKMYAPLFDGYDYVIDKTPRYWELLDELVELFPESKIIVVKRNPLDVVKSIIRTWNKETLEQLNEYRSDLLEAPLVIDAFLEKHKKNKNIISVYYEDVVNNKSEIIMYLYNSLNLPYNESVLDTSMNEKYKGLFGDPYQNDKSKSKRKIPKHLRDFIIGYAWYLGEDYFVKNNFQYDKIRETRSFNYFLDLNKRNTSVNLKNTIREINLFVRKKLLLIK